MPKRHGGKRSKRSLRAPLDEPNRPTVTGSPSERSAAGAGQDGPQFRLGHYAIERKLGEGGMGVVYAARDEKLHRTVALKTMASLEDDETARQRFWREARAAASVNHPNICQIYEIGEEDGELFIAMELLEGSPLTARLNEGPMALSETVSIGGSILAALAALHARGLVHRDLKPSNVFLTPHGVKVLDFGLARPAPREETEIASDLTRPGVVLGTPRYMAPEQALGESVDHRTDLFATGAILFEMLAGRPAFIGNTTVAIVHATVHEQPPALTGSPAVAAVDRVIRRALAKRPTDRPASAKAMADELREVHTGQDDKAVLTHTLTRLVVLPFRMLRPDPDTDFLAFSLPDAITSSLSGIGSLVLRSSAAAARFAGDTPDFKSLAAMADVDRVVTGTLMRSGEQLRAVAQLVEAPSGTVVTSHTVQTPLGDLFQLQDDLTRRIVEALALPLGQGAASPAPDAPNDARAYELYLRANELARKHDGLAQARQMYEECVALDPHFAPAWARLGRCHRVIGKYLEPSRDSATRAEEAFRRALELNPRLTVAHKLLASLDADNGHAERAMVRLLGEARRHGNDPELYAGLVHACRYCGLFDESLAAHAEARRLDPNIPTSFELTILFTGDTERLLALAPIPPVPPIDTATRVVGLGLAGRVDEARETLAALAQQPRIGVFKLYAAHLSNWLDRRPADMLAGTNAITEMGIFNDPEQIFHEGWMLCGIGEHARGLSYLERAVAVGYFVWPTLARSPHFDALRDNPAFQSLLATAEAGRRSALAAFRKAGGNRLLGGKARTGG